MMARMRSLSGAVLGAGGGALLAAGLLVPAVTVIRFPDGGPTYTAGHAATFCASSLGAFATGVSPATARACAKAAAIGTWSGVAVAAGVVLLGLAGWRVWRASQQEAAASRAAGAREESAR